MVADLKFAFRQLAKAPAFTAVAVVALALGIATATTMFTFFNALFVRPAPYLRDESSLVSLRVTSARDPGLDMEFSVPDLKDVRAQSKTLEGGLTLWDRTYIIDGDRPQRVLGDWITVDAFQTLGVQPFLGRLFRPEEGDAPEPGVVILGYDLWQSTYGGREDLIGTKIVLNHAPVTVVGVMPPRFRFPEYAELWQPFPAAQHAEEKNRGSHNWPVFARIRPGYTLEQVQAELHAIAAQLAAAHPATNAGLSFEAWRMRDAATRDLRRGMILLLGAVIAVLLIACGNVANLLLARAATRTREMAVRSALGADRARLVRQVLTESLVLGVIGGAGGLMASTWALDAVLGLIPVQIPYWVQFEFDWRVFGFVAVATMGASLVFGFFPAWHVSRTNLASELKEGGRSGMTSGRSHRVRSGLVVLQMALALVLLVVAGLTMRSFLALEHTDVGMDIGHVLTFRTGVPPALTPHEKDALPFFQRVVQQVAAVPGVEAAGFMSYLPLTDGMNVLAYLPEGVPEPKSNLDWPRAQVRSATPGVFAALRIPLRAGRLFDDHDTAETPRVAVVDERFARRLSADGQVLGKRVTFDDPDSGRKWVTIIGIVGSIRQQPTAREELAAVWMPLSQVPDNFASAVVRVQGDPASYIEAAQDAVLKARADIPIYYAEPMTKVAEKALWKQRFFGGLFTAFAGVALLLAAIGIYGVTAYNVSQRTQEIGVRMALGAPPRTVIRMILLEGARLVGAGLVLGFAVAWGVAQLLAGMLHGIQPHDPPTFAAVPVLLAGVALAACYVPGRRATLIDPLVALRAD